MTVVGGVMMICQTQECKSYAQLAVDVFKNQKQPLVKSLKIFLSTLPKPDIITEILTTALEQLAESDPNTCRWAIWILQHSYDLGPYFSLIEQSVDATTDKLKLQGIIVGHY
jgi:hypothetical protein